MIDANIFYARMAVCQTCPHWKSVCLKGHGLSTPLGCPEEKFPPVEGAGYLENRPAAQLQEGITVSTSCCGGLAAADVRELTYAEAAQAFVNDMKVWQAAGFPVLSDAQYTQRVDICKRCPGGFYRWFQCRACKCIIFSKAKVKTTVCPGGYWPPV